jgi:hypothetical protein
MLLPAAGGSAAAPPLGLGLRHHAVHAEMTTMSGWPSECLARLRVRLAFPSRRRRGRRRAGEEGLGLLGWENTGWEVTSETKHSTPTGRSTSSGPCSSHY